jgi:2-iminoacetate synthase ThiH
MERGIEKLIESGRVPVQRDTFYRPVKSWAPCANAAGAPEALVALED